MKKKILQFLFSVLIIAGIGAVVAGLAMRNTTATLGRLIDLHQIVELRQHLIMSIQTVQSDLYTVNTSLGNKLDKIIENATKLKEASSKCSGCHHAPEIVPQIVRVQELVNAYEHAISLYITASANNARNQHLKTDAAAIGKELLDRTEGMSQQANLKLEVITREAMQKTRTAWLVLVATSLLALVVGLFVALRLAKNILDPVNSLVTATRIVAGGDLDHQLTYQDSTEFGELAANFNAMTVSLREGYRERDREISERKRTEQELVRSESFLSTIFDSIRDPFCIIDRKYTVVRANEAYAQMKRISLGDLVKHRCYAALHGRDSICPDCIVQKTFDSGDPCAKEMAEVLPDDHRVWREIYTYPIFGVDKQITHVIEYTRDITERKRAEEALRVSEERYALAARGANDGLWDWDLRSNRIYFSYRWKDMLGYGEKEISDHPEEWFSRIHPDDRQEMEARISAHLNGRSTHFEHEHRILHKDGTYRWVLNRGLAVRGRDGSALRMAGSQTDTTDRKTAEEQLVYDAFHDALTGLPNRSLFMDRLAHVITVSHRRENVLYAVLFLDVDRFKTINDSLGHTVGDQLLVVLGRKLSDCLRPGDTVARLGGDEFAVLLENISDLKDAVDIAERIRNKLAAPLLVSGHEVFTAVSIGIALGSEKYDRPEQVLRDADIAMYQAKGRGTALYEVFDAKMHANILNRLKLEADLRGALEHREFLIFYQPIMNLRTHRLKGFEALVRWNHPERGIIYPMEFIPVAEENGLITSIGEWIMEQACADLKGLQERYPMQPPLTMSVNISGKQFSQGDLAERIGRIVERAGVDPRSLALEVTESMIMENVDAAAETMERLRSMGLSIHIDDFGTGYSSLSYLHRFPINALKIDRSFIRKLASDGGNKEVILSIIMLANSMNFEVIAEGVELEHQLAKIRDLQCQFGQGYLFAEPMEQHDIDSWVTTEQVLA